MIEIYLDGVLLDSDNYIGFEYTRNVFNESFYLGSTTAIEASLVIPKDALPANLSEVSIKIDNNKYLTLNVDNITINDNEEAVIKLLDSMVNLNVPYDISSLVPITAKNLLIQICEDFNIDHDTFSFTNENVSISSYDSTLTARDYLSMISELAGGYAEIDSDDKLRIKTYNNSNIINQITPDDIDTYKLGEKYKIERVVYEFGSIHKETDSDDSKNTLYLSPDNLFLQVITDSQFTDLANNILNFEFYNINIENCNIFYRNDNVLNLLGLDNVSYTILNQYNVNYFGGFVGSYKSEIKNQKQEITKVLSPSQNIKRLSIIIDQENNRITQLAQRTEALEESVEVLSSQVSTNLVLVSTDNLKVPFSTKNYVVNISCKYMENNLSNIIPTTTNSYTGISYSATDSQITFSVSDSTALQNEENPYLFTWSYTDPITGDTYTSQKTIYVNALISEVEENVVISNTAPLDTSLLWYDTVSQTLKAYIDGEWENVNDDSDELERIRQSVSSNTTAIEGSITYTLTEDTSFVENKTYYEEEGGIYTEYDGPITGDPSALGLYERKTILGLNQKYILLNEEVSNKPDIEDVQNASRTIASSIIQEETYTKLQVQQIVDGTGVDGVKVSAVVSTEGRFDQNGMTYSKSGANTEANINQSGLSIHQKNENVVGEEVFFSGYVEDNRFGNNYYHDTLVYTHNLLSTGYTEVGKHGRFQEYSGPNNEDGVGFFMI